MDLGLRDKVTVITGGAGGLGSAMARLFSAEGARVVVADRDIEAAQIVAANGSGVPGHWALACRRIPSPTTSCRPCSPRCGRGLVGSIS